jgi:hypothetical protein
VAVDSATTDDSVALVITDEIGRHGLAADPMTMASAVKAVRIFWEAILERVIRWLW